MTRFSVRIILLAVGLGFAAAAHTQDYPNRPIRFIVPFAPGGTSDLVGRVLGAKISEGLGQTVVVDNRGGAGSTIGTQLAAKASPDGHTILVSHVGLAINETLYANLPYKALKDLAPVATMATIPTVLVTSPEKGYKKAADLVAAAKANPGKVVCSTAGIGSATHMQLERFRFSAGIEVLKVHMKGAPDALTEVLAGRADCYFALVFQAKKMADAGKVVALAVGGPKRSSLMPDVPTTVELGYANSDYNFWLGVLISSKTPRPIVERLHREINALVQTADLSAQIRKLGADPLTMSLAAFQGMIDEELEANAKLIKAAGIKAN